MRKNLTYKYYRKINDRQVFLVLHGGGVAGIESPFISKIITEFADSKKSVLGFNMPYCERGEESTSNNLIEETEALKSAIEYLRTEGYGRITVIGKSLGSIIASYYLEQNEAPDVEVITLGYVIGSVKTPVITPYLKLVIQGENDRFGNMEAVKKEINNPQISIIEIPKADHSYRDINKNPIYQEEVIKILLNNI